jgi:hypothetical protein
MGRITLTLVFIILISQMGISAPSSSTILLYGVSGLVGLLILVSLILVATNIMNLEAQKYGIDITKENYSAIPGKDDFVPNDQDQ